MVHLTLSDEQRAELDRALQSTHEARYYRRLKAIDLISRGYAVPEVAAIFGRGAGTIHAYLRAFERGGIAALHDAPRSGRPRKLPPEYDGAPDAQATWQRLLDRRPATIPELQTPSHVWTLELLARYMRVFHRVEVSDVTIYHALTRAGFRRGRTKLTVTSPDPDYEVKRQRVEALGKWPGRAS